MTSDFLNIQRGAQKLVKQFFDVRQRNFLACSCTKNKITFIQFWNISGVLLDY